jgi:hypothetical protein
MTFPNMQNLRKKDIEQFGAIRNVLDKQEKIYGY